MSGGSYNYICVKDSDELFQHESQVMAMADRLAGLGYAADAARETHEAVLIMRQYQARMDTHTRRLAEIWRAVEWWDSGDSGEDGVKKALKVYRAGPAGMVDSE